MGELLRSVFGSPAHAEEVYDIGQDHYPQQIDPNDKFTVPQFTRQVASIEKWLLQSYREGIIINDDWVVQQTLNRGPLVYDDMLDHDPQVFACFEKLSGGAAKTPYKITPASEDGIAKEHAEFIRAAFEKFDFVSALMEIARGEATGYSVCELVFDKFQWRGKDKFNIRTHDGQPGVVRLDPSKVIFDYLQQPKLITLRDAAIGVYLNPRQKYVVYKRGSGVYGDALLKHAFQPYWFKKSGNVFLIKYLELFGVPPLIAYHRNEDEMRKNMAMLKDVRSSSYASFPAGPSDVNPITALQPGRDSQTLNTSLDFYNDEIAKAIIGGTRTMSSSDAKGAYSATESHADSFDDRVDNIVRRLTFVVNQQFIPSIIRINYGVQPHYPRADFGMDDQETPNDYMGRVDKWASRSIAVPISRGEFYMKSGFAKPTDETDELYPAMLTTDIAPLTPAKYPNA
jgi:phage gp29-like protein